MNRRELIKAMGMGGAIGTIAIAPHASAGQTGMPNTRVEGNGFVTMRPVVDADAGAIPRFHVLDPYGIEIDQSGTTSQGLQEAINYCAAHGYGLVVIGGANASRGEPWHMNLTATETIEVPPMRFWTWAMRGITLNGSMTDDFVHFDSLANSHIDWTGSQLVYTGHQAAVHFHPRNPPPTDPTLGMGVNYVNIPNSIAVYGNGARCVQFSPAAIRGPIFGNKMIFGELNGGTSDGRGGIEDTIGLLVTSAAGTAMFASNQIDVFAAHGCGFQTFRVGSALDVDSIKGNFWRLQSTTVPGQTVLNSFETGGLYDIYFENSGLSGTIGVRLEAIANLNRIRGYNNCATPVVDESMAGNNIFT